MNKILIALVLAVVMSGNVYANVFSFDNYTSYSECIKAIEKGDLISESTSSTSLYTYLYYLFKNRIYQIRFTNDVYNSPKMFCNVTKEE